MDVFKRLGIPIDEIEFGFKVIVTSAVVWVGVFGNLYTIIRALTRSKLPRSTNFFIAAISLALMLQAGNAGIDYVDHIRHEQDYFWSFTACDTWHALNVYLPMVLALLCFFAMLDRFVLLCRPELHSLILGPWTCGAMVVGSFLLPVAVTIPPIYFEWYTTDKHLTMRTDRECKFRTNMVYALVSPIFTFWIPLAMDAFIIVKMFRTMEQQDRAQALEGGSSIEKLNDEDKSKYQLPWKEEELRHQHRLAITLWSVYWNIALFWIPQHAWQFIYKVTDADWPRATNFMAWTGYLPCFIVPSLYLYYNVYEL